MTGAVIIGIVDDPAEAADLQAEGADAVEQAGRDVTGETAAELAVSVAQGDAILRTHHVRVARRVVDVWAAIVEARG